MEIYFSQLAETISDTFDRGRGSGKTEARMRMQLGAIFGSLALQGIPGEGRRRVRPTVKLRGVRRKRRNRCASHM